MNNLLKNLKHKKSLAWGFVNVLVTLFKQVLLVPFFLNSFGNEGFSLWILSTSVIFMIRTLNLGQLNYSSNLINIEFFKAKRIGKIVSDALASNVIILSIQISIGLLFSDIKIFSFFTKIDTSFLFENNFRIFFTLLLISRLLNQFFSLFFLRLLEPLNLISTRIKYDVLREFFELILLTSTLIFYPSFFNLGLVVFVFNLLYSITTYIILKNTISIFLENIRLSLKSSLKLINNSLGLFLNFLIEKIYENGLNIIITIIYNPLVVSVFVTTRTIANLSMRFALIVSEPLMVDLQKNYSLKNDTDIFINFKYYWKITFSFILTIYFISFYIIESLYSIWTSNKLLFDMSLFIWIFLSVFILNFTNVLTQFFRRTNDVDILIKYNFVKSTTLIVSLFLLKNSKLIELAGFSLFLAELASLIILLIRFYFKERHFFFDLMFKDLMYIFFTIIFSILYMFYIDKVIFSTSLILIFILYNNDFLFQKINFIRNK